MFVKIDINGLTLSNGSVIPFSNPTTELNSVFTELLSIVVCNPDGVTTDSFEVTPRQFDMKTVYGVNRTQRFRDLKEGTTTELTAQFDSNELIITRRVVKGKEVTVNTVSLMTL